MYGKLAAKFKMSDMYLRLAAGLLLLFIKIEQAEMGKKKQLWASKTTYGDPTDDKMHKKRIFW